MPPTLNYGTSQKPRDFWRSARFVALAVGPTLSAIAGVIGVIWLGLRTIRGVIGGVVLGASFGAVGALFVWAIAGLAREKTRVSLLIALGGTVIMALLSGCFVYSIARFGQMLSGMRH
jgi:hypothetical protein